MISGPTGVGKTTTGLQFLTEAADHGITSTLYSFEEAEKTLLRRADQVDIPIREMIDEGTLNLDVIRPFELSVDEFAQQVRRDVEEHDLDLVMVDTVNGYLTNLTGSQDLQKFISLGRYLRDRGVTMISINETEKITGEFEATGHGVSQLADTIVFLRHIEYQGELRKVIGVLKNRTNDFEQTLRELEITEHGLTVGDPLPELRGILTGIPDGTRSRRDSENETRRTHGQSQ